MSVLNPYRKAITALVTALIGWGASVVVSPSSSVTSGEWIELAVAAAIALGVYAVPNAARAPAEPAEPRG
jgi:hypothetical protein